MTIGQVAQLAGLPSSTIRYYEKMRLLPSPPRTGGQRRYSPDAVSRLALIALAQACGFRLEEVRQLIHGFHPDATPSLRWRKFLAAKGSEIEDRLHELRAMRRLLHRVSQCKCVDLEECGRRALAAKRRGQHPVE